MTLPAAEEYSFECPCCMEPNSLLLDYSAGNNQQMVTDCEICCRPIVIKIVLGPDGVEEFSAEAE